MALVVVCIVVLAVMVAIARVVFREQGRPSKHEVARYFDRDVCAARILSSLSQRAQGPVGNGDAMQLVGFVLDYMKLAGSVANGDANDEASERMIVLGGAASVEYLLERARGVGLDLDADDAQRVLSAVVEYLAEIGAIGPQAS
jgi:hypothetical protein